MTHQHSEDVEYYDPSAKPPKQIFSRTVTIAEWAQALAVIVVIIGVVLLFANPAVGVSLLPLGIITWLLSAAVIILGKIGNRLEMKNII